MFDRTESCKTKTKSCNNRNQRCALRILLLLWLNAFVRLLIRTSFDQRSGLLCFVWEVAACALKAPLSFFWQTPYKISRRKKGLLSVDRLHYISLVIRPRLSYRLTSQTNNISLRISIIFTYLFFNRFVLTSNVKHEVHWIFK